MEQKRRESIALMLAHKKSVHFGDWYKNEREQNSVAGQLFDEKGKKLFPHKKGKIEFAEFLMRCKTSNFIDGDGVIALTLILFYYRQKMNWLSKERVERFIAGIHDSEVEEISIGKELEAFNLTSDDKLELLQFISWVKQVTYRKVARK